MHKFSFFVLSPVISLVVVVVVVVVVVIFDFVAVKFEVSVSHLIRATPRLKALCPLVEIFPVQQRALFVWEGHPQPVTSLNRAGCHRLFSF